MSFDADSAVTSAEQLAELYRAPSRLVAAKKAGVLDDASVGIIERSPFVLIATAGDDGSLDVSPRGGPPGFVRVTGPSELAFPDYDGNGMFKSLGNLAVNPEVGLLFIDMHGQPRRLRVNGTASRRSLAMGFCVISHTP